MEDTASMLSEFGLKPYEARVYLAVVKLGLAAASQISKLARIRREEVYRTLPKLEKAGLVDRVLGKPIKVRALPVEEAVSILVERKREEASREISILTAKKEEFLKKFSTESLPTELEEEAPQFVLMAEKDSVSSRTASAIKAAKEEIAVVDSHENVMRFVLTFTDSLKEVKDRGVGVRILTEYPSDENLIPDLVNKWVPGNSFAIRYVDEIPSQYIIVDNREVMITTSSANTVSSSRCLWTDDVNLVGIILRDFKDQLQVSTDWRDYKFTPDEKMTRMLKTLKPRDHAILVYDSLDAKRNTLFNYINGALINDEAAVYVCSEETPDEIRTAMKQFGIEVEKHEDSGALEILDYTDVYIKGGKVEIDSIMDSWGKCYNDAMAKGFKGMKVTGEMSCFLEHQFVPELIEYEQALHTILDIPMTAICAYSAKTLEDSEDSINLYSELVKAHGKVLFAGKDNKLGKIEIRAS
ncbi:MAG: MEDS domain-containing protein [Candidatus Thorarchaeota archaeon]|jgi:sugar-specific transcriptional regulator TrmB